MESSTAKYYSRLDHLRFIAALLVLVWHSIHFQNVAPTSYVPTFWPLSILEEGHTGVALFMTLSGFIFHALCRNRKIIYLEFIRNRILRIAPLFLVWTLYLFYTENIDPTKLAVAMLALLNRDVVPGVGWTIIVEFQFYLIFPFLLSFSLRYGIRYLIALVVLAMLFRLGTWYTQGSVQVLAYWTIFGRIDQFLMGMIGSELFFRYPRQIGRLRVLISLLVAWIVLYQRFNSLGGFYNHSGYPSPSSIWVYFPTLEGIFYSLIAASYMALDRKIPRLVDKCLSWLAGFYFPSHPYQRYMSIKRIPCAVSSAFNASSFPGRLRHYKEVPAALHIISFDKHVFYHIGNRSCSERRSGQYKGNAFCLHQY